MTSVVIGAIATAITGANYIQQRKAERKSQAAQREARRIQKAEQTNENARQRAASAREERIRRARVMASASGSGALRSSGAFGAASALGSNFASVVARQSARATSANAMTDQNQKLADAQSSSRRSQATADLAIGALRMYRDFTEE